MLAGSNLIGEKVELNAKVRRYFLVGAPLFLISILVKRADHYQIPWLFIACIASYMGASGCFSYLCWKSERGFEPTRWIGIIWWSWTLLVPLALANDYRKAVILTAPFWIMLAVAVVLQLKAKKSGVLPEFSAQVVHAFNRPSWKYVTSLRIDFWLLWAFLWIPFAVALLVAIKDFQSVPSHFHWTRQLALAGLCVCLAIHVITQIKRVAQRTKFDDSQTSIFGLCLLAAGLGILEPSEGITISSISPILINFGILSLPGAAMETWSKRVSKPGIEEYESFEAPSQGL